MRGVAQAICDAQEERQAASRGAAARETRQQYNHAPLSAKVA